jgi:signal peptidase I
MLLADPAIRVAGPRVPRVHRVQRERGPRARWVLVATALMLLAGALGYLRTWPPFATVMSASMAPTINTGDIVVLKKLDRPAQIGDVVMVHVPDEARSRYGYPTVVIHRVKTIGRDGLVTTKGDARKDPDPFQVPREALTEKVVTHLPAAGQFLGFFSSTLGLLWLGGGALLFVGMPLIERAKRGASEREQLLEDAMQAAATAQAELAEHLAALPAALERAVGDGLAVRARLVHAAVPAAPPRLVAASEFVVIPARPVPPPPPVPAAPAPVPFVLRTAPARAARPVRAGAPSTHGVQCAVGGP